VILSICICIVLSILYILFGLQGGSGGGHRRMEDEQGNQGRIMDNQGGFRLIKNFNADGVGGISAASLVLMAVAVLVNAGCGWAIFKKYKDFTVGSLGPGHGPGPGYKPGHGLGPGPGLDHQATMPLVVFPRVQ
jgi:hypothetical protein